MRNRNFVRRGLAGAGYLTWLVGTAACAADSSAAPSPNITRNVEGTWAAPLVVPGSGEEWTLSLSGAVIAGTGNWEGEACCAGTVAITGSARGDSLHLDLSYTQTTPTALPAPSRSEHIDATLTSPTDLVGTARFSNGSTAPVHFIKRQP